MTNSSIEPSARQQPDRDAQTKDWHGHEDTHDAEAG